MFLGLIFFLELTAGVLAFIFKDWIKDQLNFFINNNVKAYRDDIDLQNLIDFAQEYVSVCPLPIVLRPSFDALSLFVGVGRVRVHFMCCMTACEVNDENLLKCLSDCP